MFVCFFVGLSVCLSVRSRVSETTHPISPYVLYMLPRAMSRFSSDGNAIRYVLSVLWTTSYFHIMEGMGQMKDDAYVSSSTLDGGTGCEVCRFGLHNVINTKPSLKVAPTILATFFSAVTVWTLTHDLNCEFDPGCVKMNKHSRYLGQMTLCSHTHTLSTAPPGPLSVVSSDHIKCKTWTKCLRLFPGRICFELLWDYGIMG